MQPDLLNLVVRNRDGELFNGMCRSVTSFNKVGKFDILPLHANFITIIEKQIQIITQNGEEKLIAVDNGVCKVKDNKVMIFMGIKQSLQTSMATSST